MADVDFSVLEIEQGFTVLCFRTPPEPAKMRLHCLLDLLQQWRIQYPARVVSGIQVINDGDIVRSINVSWSLLEIPSSQRDFAFNVMQNVIDKYGSEYLEALTDDASDFLIHDKHPVEVAALVSKREIVMVVYKSLKQGYVIAYEDFLKLLSASMVASVEASFHKFKMEEDSGYHVVPLPPDFAIAME